MLCAISMFIRHIVKGAHWAPPTVQPTNQWEKKVSLFHSHLLSELHLPMAQCFNSTGGVTFELIICHSYSSLHPTLLALAFSVSLPSSHYLYCSVSWLFTVSFHAPLIVDEVLHIYSYTAAHLTYSVSFYELHLFLFHTCACMHWQGGEWVRSREGTT